jgi:hypothetical protein
MKQIPKTLKKDSTDQRRAYFDYRHSTAPQPRVRHRTLINMLQPSIIERCERDWFAHRIWEDDGGGPAQMLSIPGSQLSR